MRHLILKRGELISIAIALVMLIAIGAFTALDWSEYRQGRNEVVARRKIFEHTNSLLLAVTDAETGQRGYILTDDPAYLEPYRQALLTIPKELDVLSDAATDPGSGEMLGRLRRLVAAKMAELDDGIRKANRGDRAGSIGVVQAGRGAVLMANIRRTAGEVHDQQSALIESRSAAVRYRSDRAHFLTLVGCATLLILLALGAVNIGLAATRREQLIADIEREKGQTAEVRDLLQTTLASIGDAVLVTDNRGRVTFMNRVAELLTGWKASDAAGVSESRVFPLLDEASRSPVESPVQAVLRGGSAMGFSNHTILTATDGREIPIDDIGAPIRSQSGSTLGAVVVFRDVTSRRSAERERERSRADAERQRSHLYSLFRQAPAVINIHRGPDHVFELVNPRTSELLGGANAAGMKACEAIPDPGFVEVLDQVYSSGDPQSLIELLIGDRFFNCICCPWREEDGKVAGVMTLAVDVTEQVKMREAMQASEERLRETARLESLGVLAGGIAHDFNNLLVGIIGNASMALDTLTPSHAIYGMIGDVLRAGERAATLTRQMLAYAGKGSFVIESLDLSALVEEMLPLIYSSVPKSVVLTTRFDRKLPPVEADASQLHQVFMNLVINAAEACGDRPGQVDVVTSLQPVDDHYARLTFGAQELKPGTYVSLEVSDNGSGMDETTKAKIFDPFFTTKFTGRGLGLSAVLGIIRAHEGAIKVYSEPGKGSTFRVLLPAGSVRPVEAKDSETAEPLRPGARQTVLLVDDEEVVRRMAHAALEQLGYNVIEAENGVEAVDRYREHRTEIDAVVLDLTMPLMSGEETLRRLRDIDPDVVVILSSGFNQSEATRHFEDGRLAAFLQKPYTLTRLGEQVSAALSGKR